MTTTLELNATSAEHMARVRREYDLTVVDHAHLDGCDDCGTGLDPRRPSGWEFDRAANLLLCAPCVAELVRHEAQLAAALERKVCSNGLHDLTDEAHQYWAANGRGTKSLRCKPCYLETSRASKERAKQRRAAS